jgi:spore coat polysaccharide biosynthesis protein SpsF (cytidylyltransferase family)
MLSTLGVVWIRPRAAEHNSDEWLHLLAARRFGGKSLLDWVVRRVTDAQRLDGVIVVLAADADQQQVGQRVPPDVPCYFSDRRDPLARLTAAVDEYPAAALVCVGVENPFIDPVLIDQLITAAESGGHCDYASYFSRESRIAALSQLGVLAEWISTDALRRADRMARHARERQDVASYIRAHPRKFRTLRIPIPVELDRDDLRLAISVEEDWDHAHEIYEALGPEGLEWQRIADLLDRQPALRRRMAVLNRATASL